MSQSTDEKKDDSDDGLSTANDFVQIYMITIDIIGAYNLEKADTFGKSDPYCKISAFSTSYTTCTIKKTLNPKWNEHVEMTFFNDPKTLNFQVFDYDGKLGGKDDSIGTCPFNLTPDIYNNSNGFDGKIKLQNCKSGELQIKVVARTLLPLELEKNLTNLQNTVAQNTNNITSQDEEIKELNNKNVTLENEINGIKTDINGLNEQIPKSQIEEKQEKEIGQQLDGNNKQICEDINIIEQKYNDVLGQETVVSKELEKVQMDAADTNKECEQLKKDIRDIIQKIDNKKKEEKEEKERQQREAAEAEQKEKKEKENLATKPVSDGSNGGLITNKDSSQSNVSGSNGGHMTDKNASVVFSDKFMETNYEEPNYGLLKNDNEKKKEEITQTNDNKCCVPCIVL